MEITIIETAGFKSAFKAMRLPLRSSNKSDSNFFIVSNLFYRKISSNSTIYLGDQDAALMKKLINAGDEHSKALRGIEAYLEITAPLYWWIEADTYKIGCDCLSSSSSMHCELKGLKDEELQKEKGKICGNYEYTKIIKINYQAARRLYFQRRFHRLPEWRYLCRYLLENLPYFEELCIDALPNNNTE